MTVPEHVYRISVCDKRREELERILRELGYDPAILRHDEAASKIMGKECYVVEAKSREDFLKISAAVM